MDPPLVEVSSSPAEATPEPPLHQEQAFYRKTIRRTSKTLVQAPGIKTHHIKTESINSEELR